MMKVQAQQGVSASGGDAVGSGGSVSYTVGQVDYMTANGSNGLLIEGVQQPYEISVVTGLPEIVGGMDLNVYPNPTADNVVLAIGHLDAQPMSYALYDAVGQVVAGSVLHGSRTTIHMADLSNAVYFLKVYLNGAMVRSFQITKNR